MRKTLVAVIALTALAGAACSSGGDDGGSTGATGTTGATGATSAAGCKADDAVDLTGDDPFVVTIQDLAFYSGLLRGDVGFLRSRSRTRTA